MDVNKLFPSKYVNGQDLAGREVTLVIDRVVLEKMRPNPQTAEEEKLVVYFEHAQKGLVLGKRVAFQIAQATGEDDTDHWPGKKVVLYPEKITVAGRELLTVRVKPPAGK